MLHSKVLNIRQSCSNSQIQNLLNNVFSLRNKTFCEYYQLLFFQGKKLLLQLSRYDANTTILLSVLYSIALRNVRTNSEVYASTALIRSNCHNYLHFIIYKHNCYFPLKACNIKAFIVSATRRRSDIKILLFLPAPVQKSLIQ